MSKMDSGRGGRTDFKRSRRRLTTRKSSRHTSLRRFPVIVYALADTEESRTAEVIGRGIVTDINRGGAGVILDRLLRAGMAVMLVLNPDGPGSQRIFASVAWSHELPVGRVIKSGSDEKPKATYRAGFRFEGRDDEQREFVESLIHKGAGS